MKQIHRKFSLNAISKILIKKNLNIKIFIVEIVEIATHFLSDIPPIFYLFNNEIINRKLNSKF